MDRKIKVNENGYINEEFYVLERQRECKEKNLFHKCKKIIEKYGFKANSIEIPYTHIYNDRNIKIKMSFSDCETLKIVDIYVEYRGTVVLMVFENKIDTYLPNVYGWEEHINNLCETLELKKKEDKKGKNDDVIYRLKKKYGYEMDNQESETVKHNKRMALLKNKLGEDVLDALIELITEIKYSR